MGVVFFSSCALISLYLLLHTVGSVSSSRGGGWELWAPQAPPRWVGVGPRGRGGSARWYMGRVLVYQSPSGKRKAMVLLSSAVRDLMITAGYSHRSVVQTYAKPGKMVFIPTGEVRRRSREVGYAELGKERYIAFESKVYYTRKRLGSNISVHDYRPIYSSVAIHLPTSARILDTIVSYGFKHGTIVVVTDLDIKTGRIVLEPQPI